MLIYCARKVRACRLSVSAKCAALLPALVVCLLTVFCLNMHSVAFAQETQACSDTSCSVTYPSAFFDKYAPVSAIDMVRNLPGFELDDGNTGARGFGGAAGNILINGERVSAKSDSPSSILARIPAADVSEIVVVRGQIGGLDLVGQSVIANIIRKGKDATGTWNLFAAVDAPDDNIQPFMELTYADTIAGANFTLGLIAGEYQGYSENRELLVDGQGQVLQKREELVNLIGDDFALTLNTSFETSLGKFNVNSAFTYFDEEGGETSIRSPAVAQPFSLRQNGSFRQNAYEIGIDFERSFKTPWTLKLIGLTTREESDSSESLVRGPANGAGSLETATISKTVNTESIARLELDYSGVSGHLIEVSVEGARNQLDSRFELSELSNGELTMIDVPGAQTEVQEDRIDFTLSDSFQLGEITVDALLGGESSSIAQTGGFVEDRSFFFWKPSVTLTYAPSSFTQYRARLLRRVGQLDFFDFVSQADLGDVELALGNPNLSPETLITADFTIEKRFGDIGLVSVTLFHDEIDDVADLLPLEGILEIPGNIGDGKRSGINTDITLPMDGMGLSKGRLDVSGRWQTSRVTDPLSGQRRVLSNERRWRAEATLRQDLLEHNFAWSITAYAFDNRPQFGLDEFDLLRRFYDVDAFIETRAFEGLRIRFGVENVLRNGPSRDRSVFQSARNDALIGFREVRERAISREWFINVSGTF